MTPHDDTPQNGGDHNGRTGSSIDGPFPLRIAPPDPSILPLVDVRARPAENALFTDPRSVLKRASLIIRSRWLTGLLAALIVGSTVGALLFILRPIEATAETTLLAQSPLDQILNPAGTSPAEFERRESALMNHLSVMMSRSFRLKVAESFTPTESLEIQQPYLAQGQQPSLAMLESILAKKIRVEREREREFFTVTVKHASADVALMIANRFAASYLDLVQSELHKANRIAAETLGKQAADLSNEITAIEDERRSYRKQHNLISVEENRVILEDRIKQVNLARADLRVQRAKLEASVKQAEGDLAETPLPFNNSVLSAYAGIQPLRQQLEALQVQKGVLSLRYGPNHAKMIEVDGSIASTRDALAKDYRLAFNDLQSQLALAIASENGLNADFTAAFNESLELSRLAGRLNALGQLADNKRKTLDDLYQRIGMASVDTGLPADVLRVIDPGYIHHPLVPMTAVYGSLIGFLALCAFVSTPLAVDFFDERINENSDLEAVLRVDVIGVIPRLVRTRRENRPHIVRDNADLDYAEAFLSFAGQIEVASRVIPRRILISSTLPGEGKSTLASNLASAYTRLGRRTVLVDCDFRKPSLRTFHRIGGNSGLLPWARAGFQIDPGLLHAGGQVDATSLSDGTILIPAGASDVQPARYLIAGGMAGFFELLRKEFEIVIVDTPPAGVFQDAHIVARYCDETIFVVREGTANTDQLNRLLRSFDRTPARVVGIMLNAFSPTANNPQIAHRQLYHKYGYHKAGVARGSALQRTR